MMPTLNQWLFFWFRVTRPLDRQSCDTLSHDASVARRMRLVRLQPVSTFVTLVTFGFLANHGTLRE
jgi:hypothetical protein